MPDVCFYLLDVCFYLTDALVEVIVFFLWQISVRNQIG